MKQTITPKQFSKLVLNSTIKSKIPALVGTSGHGKTSGLEYYLKKAGVKYITLVVSELIDSIEVIPDMVNRKAITVVNEEVLEILQGHSNKPSYIILDELDVMADYPEEKMTRLRQLLLERRIGTGIKVRDNVKFVLLGNRAVDAGHGLDFVDYLPNKLFNNIAFYDIEVPLMKEWVADMKVWNKKPFKPLISTLEELYVTFPEKFITPRAIMQCCSELSNVKKKNVEWMYKTIIKSYFHEYSEQIIKNVVAKRLNKKVLLTAKVALEHIEALTVEGKAIDMNHMKSIKSVLGQSGEPNKVIELLITYNIVQVINWESAMKDEKEKIAAFFEHYDVSGKSIEIYNIGKLIPNELAKDYIEDIKELS